MKIRLIILLTLGCYLSLSGQSLDIPIEKDEIFLSCDRNIYASGELIQYAVHNKGISKILYLELYNNEGTINSASILLQNGIFKGTLKIPKTCSQGHYALRAYSYYQRNFNENEFSTIPVRIVSNQSKTTQETDNKGIGLINKEQNQLLKLTLNKKHFQTREEVEVTLDQTSPPIDSITFMTISVSKKGTIFRTSSCRTPVKIKENASYLPEISLPVIHGYVNIPDYHDRNLYLSEPGNPSALRISTTDKNGRFHFPVLPYYGERTMAITMEKSHDMAGNIIIEKNHSNIFPSVDTTIMVHRTLINDLLRNSTIQNEFKTESVLTREKDYDIDGLPGDARYCVRLDDFIALNSLKEVLYEITPYVKLRQENGEEYLSVLDDRRDIIYQNPLVLLDGTPVFDMSQIFNIHPDKIDSIEVINRRYAYGSHSLDGFIMIHSSTNDFAGYEFRDKSVFFTMKGIEKQKTISSITYNKNNITTSLPDFRTTLYWEADTYYNKLNDVSFFTCDDIGNYQIVVTWITKTGNVGSMVEEFHVVKP